MNRRQPNVKREAEAALVRALAAARPDLTPDAKGYVAQAFLNLVPAVALEDIKADFDGGAGRELAGKFRAAYSSSALAANVFGAFKRHPQGMQLLGHTGFEPPQFERKCPHGFDAPPPNLDVVATSRDTIIGIESKCLEFLTPKVAKISPRYNSEISDHRRQTRWYEHMEALQADPRTYTTLDAAQLIKHAFGLAHTFPELCAAGRVTLLYLFWEPANPTSHDIFRLHRSEAAAFAEGVRGVGPRFAFMSYPDLWREWETHAPSTWLSTHIATLKQRYAVDLFEANA